MTHPNLTRIAGVLVNASPFPTDQDVLVYDNQSGEWINQQAPGSGAPEERQGIYIREPVITTVGSEVVIGRGVLFPTDQGINTGPFTFGVDLRYIGVLTDGGGTPSFVVRIYDLGTPNTPIAPILRSTTVVLGTPNYGSVRQITRGLAADDGLSGANHILEGERVYEVRGEITGSVGDEMAIDWIGFVF